MLVTGYCQHNINWLRQRFLRPAEHCHCCWCGTFAAVQRLCTMGDRTSTAQQLCHTVQLSGLLRAVHSEAWTGGVQRCLLPLCLCRLGLPTLLCPACHTWKASTLNAFSILALDAAQHMPSQAGLMPAAFWPPAPPRRRLWILSWHSAPPASTYLWETQTRSSRSRALALASRRGAGAAMRRGFLAALLAARRLPASASPRCSTVLSSG